MPLPPDGKPGSPPSAATQAGTASPDALPTTGDLIGSPPQSGTEDDAPRPCRLGPSAISEPISAAFCLCRDRAQTRMVRSEDLFQGQRELIIVHGNEVYRLFCTRNNKLILQK